MITTRNGGLFLNGVQVMRDEVDNYDEVLTEVKQKQLATQNLMTASEIFGKVETRLKEVSVICKQGDSVGNGLLLAGAVLNAFDELGIHVATNYRRLMILPRKDKATTIKIDELVNTFDKFIDAIDPRIENYEDIPFTGINGAELYDIWLRYLTTN